MVNLQTRYNGLRSFTHSKWKNLATEPKRASSARPAQLQRKSAGSQAAAVFLWQTTHFFDPGAVASGLAFKTAS